MKLRIYAFLVTLILINACVPSQSHSIDIGNDTCIPPLFNVAFPLGVSQETSGVTQRQIPPGENWQIQDALPFQQDKFGYIYMRSMQNELLLTGQFDEIYLYHIDEEQWVSYPNPADWHLGRTFVTSDGTIWSPLSIFTDNENSAKPYPKLSRFIDATGSFELVDDVSGFLYGPQVRLISIIAEDQSGLLWFFVEVGGNHILTSFNVVTNESQQHLFVDPVGIGDIVIKPDGSVWFNLPNQLVQYIPTTQETNIFEYPGLAETGKLPLNFDRVNYLFIDHSERIWFGNKGWVEFQGNNSPEWYRVIESPVFVTDSGLPGTQYFMSYQYSTYQSSNGLYWFTGGAGIVRLDLENGQWCLVTTERSDVVEDNEHNLWIAVLGHLYKYQLQK